MNRQVLTILAVIIFCVILCVALGFIFVTFSFRVGMSSDTFEPVSDIANTLLTLNL